MLQKLETVAAAAFSATVSAAMPSRPRNPFNLGLDWAYNFLKHHFAPQIEMGKHSRTQSRFNTDGRIFAERSGTVLQAQIYNT